MLEKILITGIAGFLGSNLTKKLATKGYDVFGVDDLSAGEMNFIPKEFFQQENHSRAFRMSDFSDDSILNDIKNKKYDVIIHLAAQPRVGYTVDNPYLSNDTNVSKSLKLLECARDNVRRFINISSSAVYGDNLIPTHENYTLKPQSPYALQKMTMEKYCELFSNLYGLDTVSIRPFNIFGPNQKGDGAYSTAVSAWMYAIKNNEPLRSDGTGEQTRDMVYVDNVVDIITRALEHSSFFNGNVFNAGTGTSISNNLILDWFRKNFPNCQVNSAPARLGDVLNTKADISRTKDVLGYSPIVDFWEGIELTRRWMNI